tara:strand:- start:11 stop:811 length:801 start_codon:yes stop_codon:yes gene_type:complete
MHLIFAIGLILVLILVYEIDRYLPNRISISLVVFLSALLIPTWIQEDLSIFNYVKLASVILASIIFDIISIQTSYPIKPEDSDKKIPKMYLAVYVLLIINIAEAVIFGLVKEQYVNAITGSLLILCAPSYQSVRTEYSSDLRTLITYKVSFLWILTYTVWNYSFIYSNWGAVGALWHLSILIAPILVCFYRGAKYWLRARLTTLCVFLMLYYTFPSFFRANFDGGYLHSENIEVVIVCIGFALAIILSLSVFARNHYNRGSPDNPV